MHSILLFRFFKKESTLSTNLGTVSRDWGELLMVETDKACFLMLPEMVFIQF